MTEPEALEEAERAPLPMLVLRAGCGGVLMGLANLVPGISGGTMLLAVGIYPAFIEAIAELTRFRWRVRHLILLGSVAGAAAIAILLLAGPTKQLVLERRWMMYSLFVGLTLGGVPLVWRMVRPASTAVWAGAAAGFALMLLMAAAPGGGDGSSGPAYGLLFLSGMAGASAMILPGVSGGYLLLLLGQYVAILSGIDALKAGLLDGDANGLEAGLRVVVPVGAGVVIGIVAVSNLLEAALERFPKATLGALLGLLMGAVFGLWPFQEGVRPEPGDIHQRAVLTAEAIELLEAEDWPVQRFEPNADQAAASVGLVGLGLLLTTAIGRLGRAAPGAGNGSGAPG
jgi:putative membrane protein